MTNENRTFYLPRSKAVSNFEMCLFRMSIVFLIVITLPKRMLSIEEEVFALPDL